MSNDPIPYTAEPGVPALQATAEAGWAYQTLALAYMPPLHRAVIRAVAYLTRIESYPANAPGWIVLWAIRRQVLKPLS